MRKITFFLFLFSIFTLGAQDLSKLTPQQLQQYKKMMGGSTNLNNQSNMSDFETSERFYNSDSLMIKMMELEQEDDSVLRVFGSKIFKRKRISFEPNINLPTPLNYVIGGGDELLVDVSGLHDVNFKVKVTPEGKIRIPNAGLIQVGGLTIERAIRVVRTELSTYYSGINSGETRVDIAIGNIRSIRVSVTGEAAFPGSYTLPSLATAFHALYACGGPGEIGSMRDIRVIRKGKKVASLDFYEFLMTGIMSDNIVLQDDDIVLIAPNNSQVKMDGAIKRRALYEVLPGESLEDLIRYGGGFREDANRSLVSVFRIENDRRRVIDVPNSLLSNSMVKGGDSVYIAPVPDYYDNRVFLTGAVHRPGAYAVQDDSSVRSLINIAGGVSDEAFVNMAQIIRRRSNQIPEVISFNLSKVLSGEHSDISLQRNDSLNIDSISSFMEKHEVRIAGEVLEPGEFVLDKEMKVKDLIYMAKGFTERASTSNIQLIRIIKDPRKMEGGVRKSFNVSFEIDKDLNIVEGSGDMLLENGDLVIVRPIEGIEYIRIASVQGEVKNPGYYNIESKNTRVSDLLALTGGTTQYAFIDGAYLIRSDKIKSNQTSMSMILSRNLRRILQSSSSTNLDANMLDKMQVRNVEDLAAIDTISNMNFKEIENMLFAEGVVSLSLRDILRDPSSYKNINIEDGDILVLPRRLQTVKVLGEVMYPSYVVYSNSDSFKDFITSSGGFSDNALRKNSFVLYPNGRVIGTRSFLGIKAYPKVVAGSIIVVPRKTIDLTSRISTGELVSITTSLTSVTALIYSILRN
jgi:protein involved in polysaccharide export with SLBB domain